MLFQFFNHKGSGPVDLNRSAIFEDTVGVRPSQPIHVGAFSRTEERERLQTSYNNFHNFKLVMHDRRKGKKIYIIAAN